MRYMLTFSASYIKAKAQVDAKGQRGKEGGEASLGKEDEDLDHEETSGPNSDDGGSDMEEEAGGLDGPPAALTAFQQRPQIQVCVCVCGGSLFKAVLNLNRCAK